MAKKKVTTKKKVSPTQSKIASNDDRSSVEKKKTVASLKHQSSGEPLLFKKTAL